MKYIRVTNKQFSYGGKPIRLRGFGIGTWLNLEHFMMGLPASEQTMKSAFESEYGPAVKDQFFKKYREEFFKEEDYKLLKECGVNFIRVPFNYRLFIDDNHTEKYLEEGFSYLDSLFALCLFLESKEEDDFSRSVSSLFA